MRILQVITSLQIGGAEKVVTDLSIALKARGYDVTVAVFAGGSSVFKQKLMEGGCRVMEFSNSWDVYNWNFIGKLHKIIKNYDVVHTHNTSPQLFTALANVGRKTKLVTTEHSTNNRRRTWYGYKWVDRWMYKRYDKIVCISDIAKEKLQEYLKTLTDRLITINNGVDVNRFYQAVALPELSHTGIFVTVMVAGFREAKDQDTAIKAMALLPDNYHLWLVGDGVRRSELESLIKKLGLSHRITLMGIRSDIPQILKSADTVLMSSHWEGLSLSNIEGMSSGKPFIASDVNGLREVTKGYGILFPHENTETLAAIIRKLHDDVNYYSKVAEACYKRAQMFDIKKMVDRYEAIYKEVLS